MTKITEDQLFNNDGCIQTFTGKWLNVLNPDPKDIDIVDIAHALSHNCRWTGHTKTFYSVARHSIYVANLLPEEHQLAGLGHDFSEAFLSDISRPLKNHLIGYKEIEDRLMHVIANKFGFQWPMHELVKWADDEALKYEWTNYIESDRQSKVELIEDMFAPSIDATVNQFLTLFLKLTTK